jgi:hypothetical protein
VSGSRAGVGHERRGVPAACGALAASTPRRLPGWPRAWAKSAKSIATTARSGSPTTIPSPGESGRARPGLARADPGSGVASLYWLRDGAPYRDRSPGGGQPGLLVPTRRPGPRSWCWVARRTSARRSKGSTGWRRRAARGVARRGSSGSREIRSDAPIVCPLSGGLTRGCSRAFWPSAAIARK